MRVMIIGPLSGRLGEAGMLARESGARLEHADDVAAALRALAGGVHVELVFCDVAEPIAELVGYLRAQRHDIEVIACGGNDQADAAVAAIRAGAREYLPLPPDRLLIAAILQEASQERNAPIARDPKERKRMAIVEGGRRAVTRFRALERFGDAATFFEAELLTGRTHQVRVHMASIGHPLLGDPVYGRTKAVHRELLETLDFRRQALHAARLGFIHPVTSNALSFDSEMPADMQELFNQLLV